MPNTRPRPTRNSRYSHRRPWMQGLWRTILHRKKELLAAFCLLFLIAVGIFLHYYIRFSRIVDQRLSGQIFHRASLVLSAPIPVVDGEAITPRQVEDGLRKAFYSEGEPRGSGVGTFRVSGNRLLVFPGPDSFLASGAFQEDPAALSFRNGHLTAITDLAQNAPLTSYNLEPEVITTLFDPRRSKRLIINFADCPPVLLDAVLSAEDRRFFTHHGVNFFRLVEATLTDIRADARLQGGSTLTMQLARNFFLVRKKTIKRKLDEIFLAFLLEQRLSKREIFTLYANQVYMGQRDSFSIYGFGEATATYFNKSLKDVTLPQAALIAGMIRGPNLYSPYRHPRRTTDRRNWVLHEMAKNHYITAAQEAQADAAPLGVVQGNARGGQAPYFVDMVKDQMLNHIPERDLLSRSYRVYTTLNPGLQIAASNAVDKGMKEVDKLLAARRRKGAPPLPPDEPQAALVVLDPHTGGVLALVGGRDYAQSQVNHALAMRQPGSSFKPFVYAAALNSGIDGSQPLITTATTLPDQPMTFQFGNQTYSPKDYKGEYYGVATVREALALSLNVATVNLAQMTGYEKIRDLALSAGFNNSIQATPAIALGAYVVSPLELAGGYTVFANKGVYEKPRIILAVKDEANNTVWKSSTVSRQVLDPRVCFLVVNLMESVIDHGTGEGARTRGFLAPAAAKTGTLNDGWFSGFTSNLLATAWVGYDNDKDLGLTGADSALPVWTYFMKAAIQTPGFEDVQPFAPPIGIIVAPIGRKAALLTANNPLTTADEVFIDGTQPASGSTASGLANWLKKIIPFGHPKNRPSTPNAAAAVIGPTLRSSTSSTPAPDIHRERGISTASSSPVQPAQKKEGVLQKFFSLFGHRKHKQKPEVPPSERH